MKKKIKNILLLLAGTLIGTVGTAKTMGETLNSKQNSSDKYLALFLMMNQWVKVKQQGKSVVSYCVENGLYKIAIYGMGYVGETLKEELKESDIEIVYGIDKMGEKVYADFKVVLPEDDLEEVDAVIVTAITFFDDIKDKLSEKINYPILSLEDILYEL